MSALLPTYSRADLSFSHGDGAYLVTGDGQRYLDFCSGIGVTALGHAHPHLVAKLTEQVAALWHSSNLYRIDGQERLAERLCAATFADQVFFTNSGTEAIECALKMVRKYHATTNAPARYRVITFKGAFHGRTLAAIAAGGQSKHLSGFGPPMDGFDQISDWDIAAVRDAISEQTAGILIEPIQGEGGIRVVPGPFLKALRTIADDFGLLLIFDEVQSGVGRTGSLFAHEKTGISPDIMAIAKGIGGGFPVGACLASAKAAEGMSAGSHGSTFGGNPLAMAAGNAVLDILLEPGFLGHVQNMALRLHACLAEICENHPDLIEGIRGEGLMIGLKVKTEPQTFVRALREARLLTVGASNNVVRLLPPLIITEAEITEASLMIGSVCDQLRLSLK